MPTLFASVALQRVKNCFEIRLLTADCTKSLTLHFKPIKGVVSYGFWGMIPVAFRLCMSEPYDTRWANQVVPYGPYGPPEVLIFAQKNSGKFKFLFFWAQKCPLLGPY